MSQDPKEQDTEVALLLMTDAGVRAVDVRQVSFFSLFFSLSWLVALLVALPLLSAALTFHRTGASRSWQKRPWLPIALPRSSVSAIST